MEDIVDEDDLEPIFGGPRVVHNRWFSKDRGQYFVMIYGMFTDKDGEERYMHDFIPYAQYVLYKEKEIIAQPWEYIYHLNRNWKDDRVENLKVINIHPIPIEVKYPYDPEKYTGTRNWDKRKRNYYVCLYLKKEYKNDKNLKKEIRRPINIYITETEKLKRFIKKDEKVIYIDNDKLNYNKDNLTYKTFEQAEYPFVDYFIGSLHKCINTRRNQIKLHHKTNKKYNKHMFYSRYRKQVIEGRFLSKDEEVDHIDANPLNDADDNLQILTVEEHEKKSIQDRKEMSPRCAVLCDGCENEFEKSLWRIRGQIKRKTNILNNLFCSRSCREKYIREGSEVEYKKLIKYICAGTGKEIEIPENSKFLPSKFNPDALPFYDYNAVLKWIKNKII